MTIESAAVFFETADIHVWAVDADCDIESALLDVYAGWLTPAEQERWQRFHFPQDRRRYLITRALIRDRLSYYRPDVPPAQWRFECNAYGRPELTPPLQNVLSCSFNLSHTAGAIVLAVSRDGDLGVDVERRRPLNDLDAIARQHFAADEVRDLFSLPAERREARFFDLWTLKESYIKARGMGLAIPLDSFGFRFDENANIEFFTLTTSGDLPERWHFVRGAHDSSNQLAVALRKSDLNRPPKVRVERVLPASPSQEQGKSYWL
ncbi:MAG: 4'-phosphopantetheinyl transferase superfamily protein [Gammaproteobacteria bacterium]